MTEAIDQLDAGRRGADDAQLAAQVAAIWAMVRDLDPELARLIPRYAGPPEEHTRPPEAGS